MGVVTGVLLGLTWLWAIIRIVLWVWRMVSPVLMALFSRRAVTVAATDAGLLYCDGVFQRVLSPGSYRFWGARNVVNTVDMRPWQFHSEQVLQTQDHGQIVMIGTLTASVADPHLFYESHQAHQDAILSWMRSQIREVFAMLTLQEIRKGAWPIVEGIQGRLTDGLAGSGLAFVRFDLEELRLPVPDRLFIADDDSADAGEEGEEGQAVDFDPDDVPPVRH